MKLKKFISKVLIPKLGHSVAALALMITALNVNSACFFTAHQPELPKSAQKFRKF